MTWGMVAIAGTTLVATGVNAAMGSEASGNAADAQERGANQSAQLQRESLTQQQKQYEQSREDALSQYNTSRGDALNIYNTSRADLSPYRDIGSNALMALSDALGIARPQGMAGKNVGNASFQKDPGYQFAFDEGLKAVDSRFGGMSRSGAKMKALDSYGQGVANQEYGNWLARLSGLASVGQSATGQSATLGANQTSANNALGSNLTNTLTGIGANNSAAIGNYGINAGNLLENASAARASGYVGGANATSGAISGGVNNLLSLYGMSGGFGGGSGSIPSVGVTPRQAYF